MKHDEFWQNIRAIAQLDRSPEPPSSTLERGYGIFQPARKTASLLQLRPEFAGMIRRGAGSKPLIYEIDDRRFVQLEPVWEADGARLSGFVSGMGDPQVLLFRDERTAETTARDGEFEFDALPAGWYSMAFIQGEESHWILGLSLGESPDQS